jgi:hypothetical protein
MLLYLFALIKGIPNSSNNSFASPSFLALVTIITSKPLIWFTLSKSISGKIISSLIPKAKFPLPSN